MARHGRSESGTTIVEIAVGLAVGAHPGRRGPHPAPAGPEELPAHLGGDGPPAERARGHGPRDARHPGRGREPAQPPAGRGDPEPDRPSPRFARPAGTASASMPISTGTETSTWGATRTRATRTSTSSGRRRALPRLLEQRGTQGGQPDAGTAWVADGGAAPGAGPGHRDEPGPAAGAQQHGHVPVLHGDQRSRGAPNTELAPPAAVDDDVRQPERRAARERIARVVVTLTGRASIGRAGSSGSEVMNKTLTSDARARNVP